MNKAHLAKLAWRVIMQDKEAWCKITCSKYRVSFDNSFEFKPKQRASSICKGLV